MPDILLTPTNPISSSFHVKGLTCGGRKFVALWARSGLIRDNETMVIFKAQANLHGLSVSTDWTCAGRALAS